jgi:carbon storage regulator CsrA
MLVLSRRIDQRIRMHTSDGPVVITITRVGGRTVGLGIEAPAAIRIIREELEDRLPRPRVPADG